MDRSRYAYDKTNPRSHRERGMISSIVVKPEAPPPSPEETSPNDFEPFQIVKQSKVRLPEKVYEPKPHPVMWKAPPFHPRKDVCTINYRYEDWGPHKSRVLLYNYPMPIIHGYCPELAINSLPIDYPHGRINSLPAHLTPFQITLTTTDHHGARSILNLLRSHAEDGNPLESIFRAVDKKSKRGGVAEKALRAARGLGIPVLEEFFEGKSMLAGEGYIKIDGDEAKMAVAEDAENCDNEDGEDWELL